MRRVFAEEPLCHLLTEVAVNRHGFLGYDAVHDGVDARTPRPVVVINLHGAPEHLQHHSGISTVCLKASSTLYVHIFSANRDVQL